jgi:hypothetical protein
MKKIFLACMLLGFLSIQVSAPPKVTGAQVVDPFYRLACEVFSKPYIPISLAVLMWAYAGAKWISAQDDDEQRMLAKDIMVYVLVGMVLLILNKQLVKILFGIDVCPP